nr:exo-alpha-sialidase [Clostridia bacterium]
MNNTFPVWDDRMPFPALDTIPCPQGIGRHMVQDGRTDEIKFLHDTAVVTHQGRLLVAWYNSTVAEIVGRSMIRGRWSEDGGCSWGPVFTLSEDDGQGLHHVPVDLISHQGTLYALISKMKSHDRPVSFDLHRMEADGSWHFVRQIAGSFIANTPPLPLRDGRHIILGRADRMPGGHPEVPAALISQSGALDGAWRLSPFFNLDNPGLYGLQCPETTAWVEGDDITAFVRCDDGRPHSVFVSRDAGETWEGPFVNPLPMAISKITAGNLLDGRRYIAYNALLPGQSAWSREHLLLCVAASEQPLLAKAFTLLRGHEDAFDRPGGWSYPSVHEANGLL